MNLARMNEDSFFEGDKEDHAAFMDRLKESIAIGVYLEEGMSKNHMRRVRVSVDPDEDYDRMFAAGYNQTMEEAENDKEEQYKQERDTLKYQLEQLKKNYESDLESIEAKYQKEIAVLKEDLAKQSDDSYKEVTVKNTVPDELYMTINEIVSDAKEWFHESGASELTNMLYRYVKNHQYYTNDDLWEQIASIIPAIEKRTAPQQSISVNNADQVNINPHQVHNHLKD
jgi:flagellar biosynthesis GTPase FlhF